MCMNSALPRLIVISGPTATGKSDFAVDLALLCKGEIISLDSRQMYVGGDLCSGKITQDEMCGIKHHLLSVFPMGTHMSVSEITSTVHSIIQEILHRGNTPILCGGTGMYIDAIVSGTVFPLVKPNYSRRTELELLPTEEIAALLLKLDPIRYQHIDTKNKRRMIRAIEIAECIGSVPPVSKESMYHTYCIYLDMPDDVLKERIQKRIDMRIKNGMIDEVRDLLQSGITPEYLESLGLEYRHISRMLVSNTAELTMQENLFFDIWHYAKRQRVWWKKKHIDHVCNPLIPNEREQALKKAVDFINAK